MRRRFIIPDAEDDAQQQTSTLFRFVPYEIIIEYVCPSWRFYATCRSFWEICPHELRFAVAWANDLSKYGVAVVRAMDKESREQCENSVWNAMDEFPEFKLKGKDVQRVLGGFGALGNPSSFHHPVVRDLRKDIKHRLVQPMLHEYAKHTTGQTEGVYVEMLFDRLCVRDERNKRPSPEAWHRDVYEAEEYKLRPLPNSLPGGHKDIIFGGWINVDHREQQFVGLVGSHKLTFTGVKGFSTFNKVEITDLGFEDRLKAQAMQSYGNTLRTNIKGEIVVPPGHIILFNQGIIHSIKSGPQPNTPALRIFHGFRLTGDKSPLFDIDDVIEHGGVPRIPSGQLPPMYSKNHYSAFVSTTSSRWREWGHNTFQENCLFERNSSGYAYKTPGSKNNANALCNKARSMPSLTEMQLMSDMYVYSASDKAIMSPEALENGL
jgi:hypothetical protein